MKRYVLHAPFNIYHFESQQWAHSVHKHTYFEIIFILRGSGVHSINSNSFPYAEGDVFLLGPEDYHYFEISELTEFCFIRFNESYRKDYLVNGKIRSDRNSPDRANPHSQLIQALLYTSSQSRGSIIADRQEKQKLRHLLAILESEYENQQSHYFEPLRDSLMQSMMIILSRNLLGQTTGLYGERTDEVKSEAARGEEASAEGAGRQMNDSIEAVLLYIRQHIYQPKLLTLENLAKEFNYAPAYIGNFFKKNTGHSLKQYIVNHKIKLVEARLIYSDLSIGQIADEFGYSDESHLCKQFKKYAGVSPTTFRKRN